MSALSQFVALAALLATLTACGPGPPAGPAAQPASSNGERVPVMTAVGAHQIPVGEIAAAIEARVGEVRSLVGAGDAQELGALYSASGHTPLWLDGRARPSRVAHTALALIHEATDEGLDPEDYQAAALAAQASALGSGDEPGVSRMAAFDVDLSVAVLRFLRHVHVGRLDPRTIGFRLTVPADDHGFAAVLLSSVADNRLREAAAELRPAIPLYEPLREQLGDLRARAAQETLESLPQPSTSVHPGGVYAGVPALARRLIVTGDLAERHSPAARGTIYDGPMVEAVTRFQLRHGLEPDGVLGQATVEALSVPLARRVRQVEIALERLRWLPHLAQGRVILVNIPMFHLWSWDRLAPGATPVFDTGVVVGRALGTETPVFVEDMRYVVFRPYWNVPPSILRGEVLPRIVKDAGYLDRERMEIVWGPGDQAPRVEATPENLALLRQGTLRVRQRPGSHNALGLVKFMFPNQDHVYLHGTPAQALFSRARRDFRSS